MQKWEYLSIMLSVENNFVMLPDRMENSVERATNTETTKMLNYLGSLGWELCYGKDGYLVFKRPR